MKIDPNSRFSLLTVVGPAGRHKYYDCQCDCGARKEVRGDHLISGRTISCGCEHKRRASLRLLARSEAIGFTHGHSNSRAYNSWCGMKQRCTNPKSRFYKYYGGRGISVCERWLRSFGDFYADMGEPPEGTTLDRIDNGGNYEPSNCRWATRRVQQNNTRQNQKLTYTGKTLTLSEWARELGISRKTIEYRFYANLPVSEILSPDRRKDLSGLSLGGKANGARQLAKMYCKNGHEFTLENTRQDKRQRVCRACKCDRESARRRLRCAGY